MRFAAIKVFAALHEFGLSRLPRLRDLLLSGLQFALHVTEPRPLGGSLTFPIGFLLIEFDGVGSQLLRVFLSQFAEVGFPLLALVLQFGERLLDVRIVRLAVALNDGSIGIAARLEACSLLGERSFLFVEFARPLHAELLPLGFPIELQPPQRFIVFVLQLLTLLFDLAASRVHIGLLLPALFGPLGLQLPQRLFVNPLVLGELLAFLNLLLEPRFFLIAEVFDLAVQLPSVFLAEPRLFLVDLRLDRFEDRLLLASHAFALVGQLLALRVGHRLRVLHRGLVDFVLSLQLLLERSALLLQRLIRLSQFSLSQLQLGENLFGLLKPIGELLFLLRELLGSQPRFFLGVDGSQSQRSLLAIELRELFVDISFSAFQLGDSQRPGSLGRISRSVLAEPMRSRRPIRAAALHARLRSRPTKHPY